MPMKDIDLGPNEYRRTGAKEPFFLPGAGMIAATWAGFSVAAIIVAFALSFLPWDWAYDLGYNFSCNYITGSCRPQ
jgi:hypothetical protein